MKRMWCVIIGLDGLEYTLVEKFDLKHIKQVEYGKVDLSGFDLLATPMIWASFICGLPPEKHGITIGTWVKWKNPFLELAKNISVKLGLWRIPAKRKLFEWLGFEREIKYPTKEYFESRRIKTIFDLVDNSVAISVPSYQPFIDEETVTLLREAIKDSNKEEIFLRKVWGDFQKKKELCLREVKQKAWELFMVHFHISDHIGHLFRGDLTTMFETYITLDKLIQEIKQSIEENVFLLIISDHGMKPFSRKFINDSVPRASALAGRYGEHSEYGFYSCNQELGLENPKITDFYPLIRRVLVC